MPGYRVKFETFTIGHKRFHIRSLLDRQQYYDPDGEAERAGVPAAMWPIFGQVWPAGLFLAETMASYPFKGRRILEIGCGIALASMVLHRRGADISSTDLHPLAAEFLDRNLELNELTPLPYHSGSWSEDELPGEKYDLIIGSDLLYEAEHPQLLADFIERHASERAEVIIVDPGRGNHGKFRHAMETLGYLRETAWAEQHPIRETFRKGQLLNFRRGVQ